jgi:hypothetical protein
MSALAEVLSQPSLVTTLPGGVRVITPLRVVPNIACCAECGRGALDPRNRACRASGCPLVHAANNRRRGTVTP